MKAFVYLLLLPFFLVGALVGVIYQGCAAGFGMTVNLLEAIVEGYYDQKPDEVPERPQEPEEDAPAPQPERPAPMDLTCNLIVPRQDDPSLESRCGRPSGDPAGRVEAGCPCSCHTVHRYCPFPAPQAFKAPGPVEAAGAALPPLRETGPAAPVLIKDGPPPVTFFEDDRRDR